MTNFNPDGNFRSIEEWEDMAEVKAANTGMASRVIGGVLVGGAGLAFGVELLGGVIAAWIFKSAWDAFSNSGKRLSLVRNCGCNAFVLDETSFITYVKQFGEAEVLKELLFVKESSIELSSFAENWFRSKNKTLSPVEEAKTINSNQSVNDKPTFTYQLPLPPAPSLPIETSPKDSFYVSNLNNDYAWVNQILELPFRVISGGQGSGKSTLERHLISELKKREYHIIIINPEVNQDLYKGVEVLVKIEQINDFLSEFPAAVARRQDECRTMRLDEDDYYDYVAKRNGRNGLVAIFFQEANTYESGGVNPTVWSSTLRQCLTNIRKWGFTATFTAHSANQTSVASKLKGFSKLLDSQPRIDCISKPDPVTGKAVSSGRGTLKMEGINDPNSRIIKLKNSPKTKDFRTDEEKSIDPKFGLIQKLKEFSDTNIVEAIKSINPSVPNEALTPLIDELKAIATQQEDIAFLSKFSLD